MKIAVIGTGYVGLVTGTCFAESGNEVTCVDLNEQKVKMLREGKIPIYEPGLEEMVKRNVAEGRLSFATEASAAVKGALVIFIAVGTPMSDDGAADLTYVLGAARDIGKSLDGYKIIVDKSTCPVGTSEKVQAEIRKHTEEDFDVVVNPEFLKEGTAVEDFLRPERVVLGCDNPRTAEILKALYAPFVLSGNPILVMSRRSAELTKYAANCFLATKISFINEMARLADLLGADISDVRQGIITDSRIGKKFLYPGIGYGGSCFPKDVMALIKTAKDQGYPLSIMEAVDNVNDEQKKIIAQKIISYFKDKGGLKGKTIAVWGLAFKPNTDDVREAPALTTIDMLLEAGAKIQAYDPKAMEEVQKHYGSKVALAKNAYAALEGAEALAIITEWSQFRTPNFDTIREKLKGKVVFDGRNLFEPKQMKKEGLTYICLGRPL